MCVFIVTKKPLKLYTNTYSVFTLKTPLYTLPYDNLYHQYNCQRSVKIVQCNLHYNNPTTFSLTPKR